jgi:hypothetical protein
LTLPDGSLRHGHADFGRMQAYADHLQALKGQLKQQAALRFYTIVLLARCVEYQLKLSA